MGNVMHRGKGSFTHVENTIFFDHGLSAKAKGIYCQIRSLEGNPEWVFTIKGFASLVRDGADAVTAGIKELEAAGYIIRARKRSENGRFLKAEEATWVTLDDPAMHDDVCAELKADGFAVLSEFEHSQTSPEAPHDNDSAKAEEREGETCETDETGKSSQLRTRTGKPVSGKPTSGKPAPINYSSDKSPKGDKELKEPLSCDSEPADRPGEKGAGDFREYRKGEFPEPFERLCALSLKPLTSLKFKRDCLKVWKARVASGFEPEQIIDAYAAYAKDYWIRNGDDNRLAKNLPRWLECDDGLAAWADEPIAPDILGADGEPLDMPGLAQVDPGFAKLWRKVQTRRSVIRSQLYMDGSRPPEFEVLERCAEDASCQRYWAACEERYGRYVKMCEVLSANASELEHMRNEAVRPAFMQFERGCA
ncbi:MAG: hypothetical protein DBY20_06535 [Coriobacteriia bacterium]|nr:MAG: hypothetical protein DBY20_06535 [Coriobacteriia bacterium]